MMLTMVIKYCQSCVPCQERSAQRPGEPLHPRLEREVGVVVHLDLLFMPAGENGCNYIFDARDNLTGFVDGRAIRTKTDPVLTNCIEEYYLRYPFVKEFVMDQGSEFTCNEVRTLLAGYSAVANYTTVAHPQANAPLERGHSTITNLLANWTEGKPSQWRKFLRAAFFVENVTVKRTTKYAPITLWYGRHATFPIESFMKAWRRHDLEVNLSFEELLDIRARQVGAAEERLREATERPLARQIRDRAHDWEDCQAQLRQAFRRPEPERPEPRVERRQRSKRPRRDPETRGAIAIRRGRKASAQREEPAEPVQAAEPAQAAEPVQAAGPAQVAELPPTRGLELVEFCQITGSDLRGLSPKLPEEREAVLLRMWLDRLEAHLDVFQWGTSQLGGDPVELAQYEPAEEPPGPESEAEPHESGELGTEEVITIGDDTPPPTPIPEQVRQYWPEGIPEPDSEEIPVPPLETITLPPKQAEPGEREESERARIHTIVPPQLAEHAAEHLDTEVPPPKEPPPELPPAGGGVSAGVPLRGGHGARAGRPSGETAEEKSVRVQARIAEIYEKKVRMEAAGEAPTPPVDPGTRPPQPGGMEKVFLDSAEAEARRKAEEKSFSFRASTELASQQVTPMAIETPAEKPAQRPQSPPAGGSSAERSPTILLEVRGGTVTGAVVAAEPETMEEEASRLDEIVAAMELDMPSGGPQRQETPERVLEMGELKTQWGSWATEADSGGRMSEQH
ncbi:hypothetical protein CBR_g28636 [Chara braunii]|uniref:Integrase catalytic domain-containing protein n=1 Tax=Chara braunii TaxID=69332 RepID=A0A388L9E0_CHABU|nr:hypothetical protein CBR_g28636 [Chara braunii]|eukprot:GBG78921.1 hypothetical protein CBR_g28636 [Chara braunii]